MTVTEVYASNGDYIGSTVGWSLSLNCSGVAYKKHIVQGSTCCY